VQVFHANAWFRESTTTGTWTGSGASARRGKANGAKRSRWTSPEPPGRSGTCFPACPPERHGTPTAPDETRSARIGPRHRAPAVMNGRRRRRESGLGTLQPSGAASTDRRGGYALIRKPVQDPGQKSARLSVAPLFPRKGGQSCVQDAQLAGILILERWLLIHDQGTEAAVAALHTDCFSAG